MRGAIKVRGGVIYIPIFVLLVKSITTLDTFKLMTATSRKICNNFDIFILYITFL
jgi:hypothetical protein